ncbi:MAG: hypothetical protein H0U59_00905 [Gemmatimonadaceae bacterium]|nr:hypothetical protein [Gemmatimonadaceae bacterium]
MTDGDTVRVYIDRGFRDYSEKSIRLLDVDAKEKFTGTLESRALGIKHRIALEDWEEEHRYCSENPDRWPFYVRTFKDRQTFNRYVGVIWCEQEHSMNEHMRSVTQAADANVSE